MKFEIKKEIFELFPNLSIAVIIAKNLDNSEIDKKTLELTRARETQIRNELKKDKLAEIENIAVWRKAYSSFGAKPKKYKASIEALLRRILEGETLPSINKLVDIYNYLSIKHLIPIGGDDLKKVEGDIQLAISDGTEKFKPINTDEEENPKEGEVIYKDNNDVLCRRWNWRECEKTKLDENTKNVILYSESLIGIDVSKKAMEEFLKLIKEKFNVEAKGFIMNKEFAVLNIDSLELEKTDYNIKVKEDNKKDTQEKKKKDKKKNEKATDTEVLHWADQVAKRVMILKGDKETYTVASGITPSGTVHIGNFREIITTELVARALKDKGKKVRFIYSWDNYDVFRKVPINMPNQELLKTFLRKPITDVPDTYDCEHGNYARHNEEKVENTLPLLGIDVEFISQAEKYKSCSYTKGMQIALENAEKIKEILNEYRKEPLHEDWLPVSIFCEKCGKDTILTTEYKGENKLYYKCKCDHEDTFDFSAKGIAKLKWRIDWPMRWQVENVDFEPGGKDHSAYGGSRMTGELIAKKIYDFEEPVYQVYEWIKIKGGKQFSSSAGVATTLNDCLEIYEPSIIRFLFAGSRPSAEFAISFDLDVFKIYEDFDKCERIYYKQEEAKNEKEFNKQKRIYELSSVGEIQKEMPLQPSFRHLTNILQINEGDIEKSKEYFRDQIKNNIDEERFKTRAKCALNWLKEYAPEEMKFRVQNIQELNVDVSEQEKEIMNNIALLLKKQKLSETELHDEFYAQCKKMAIEPKDFFKAAYNVLIGKDKGPKLAAFVIILGDKAIKLFESV